VVQLTHLPELARFVEFGETRPEDVQGRFRGEHLHVSSTSLTNLRTLAGGPNEGRRYATVDVARRPEAGGPVGQLGDEFTLRFEFTAFEEDGPLLLYGVQVTQPRAAADVCAAARELAAPEGLSSCHPDSAQPPAAPGPEGFFHACAQDDEERLVDVYCVGPTPDTRLLRVALALSPQTDPSPSD